MDRRNPKSRASSSIGKPEDKPRKKKKKPSPQKKEREKKSRREEERNKLTCVKWSEESIRARAHAGRCRQELKIPGKKCPWRGPTGAPLSIWPFAIFLVFMTYVVIEERAKVRFFIRV